MGKNRVIFLDDIDFVITNVIYYFRGGVAMFANQVKAVREQLGISQKKLGEILGVSFATINRWENSKNTPSQLAQNSFYDFCESNFIDTEELKKL